MSTPQPRPVEEAHVLVVGAGGIGCPAAWALKEAGVGRITIVDPDVVELSNLPRQILYWEENLGAPKAPAAAARLDGDASEVRGVHARFDHTNEAALLQGVDVLLDATDGATTKDWLNQLAVRRAVPFVHAAALRSEARLLSVPPGGRPCLACLFGRLTEETGSCADLGVWNGAVGTIGFLAADAALAWIQRPAAVQPGYAVLDFEGGRAMTLGASADAGCPVCATSATVEVYPEDPGCAAPEPVRAPSESLDLSTERCPMNLLRARRALAGMERGRVLEIVLGVEGAETVPDGVRALGHTVLESEPLRAGLRIRVAAGGDPGDGPMDDESLRRFARQIVLPEVGERGQERLLRAHVHLAGQGPALEVARIYLEAAGVGAVTLHAFTTPARRPADGALVAWVGGRRVSETLRAQAPGGVALATVDGRVQVRTGWDGAREQDDASDTLQRAFGTLLADAVQRRIVLEDPPARSFALPLE